MASKKTRTQLQSLFQSGAKPSGSDFQAFIDSMLNVYDDGIEKQDGADQPIKVAAQGAEENLLDFYGNDLHTWRLNQKPAGSKPGLNIATGGISKLFLESSTGNLGLNTAQPQAKLHIQQLIGEDSLRIDDAEGDTTPFVVNSDGNVGIGSALPESKLHVAGGELTVKASHSKTTADIGKFQSSDLVKGIGIGSDRIQAIGTATNQGITLTPKGTGQINLAGSATISQALSVEEALSVGKALSVGGSLKVTDSITTEQSMTVAKRLVVGQSSATGYRNVTADVNDLIVSGQFAAGGAAGSAIYKLGIGYEPPSQGEGALTVAGNVGIGTTNPSVHLAIGDNDTGFKQQGDGELAIFTQGKERVRVDAAGNVGIGTNEPRSALDTRKGVMTGAVNDYMKAQFTLSGGGTVSWGGKGKRLHWTQRFIAIAMEHSVTFSGGHINIDVPTADVPVVNGNSDEVRSSTAADGIVLNSWEALYAVHTVGGDQKAISFKVAKYNKPFSAPSNWILVAVVNGDNDSIKLGTGTIIRANSASTYGSTLPTGIIMMWHSATNTIPVGWALCDGKNGTPDLRDRFVVGAGNGYKVAATGGVKEVTLSIDQMPAHNHDNGEYKYLLRRRTDGKDTVGKLDKTANEPDVKASNTIKRVGGGKSHENRPPYYALCYIMKL